jgi:hypothetical protein
MRARWSVFVVAVLLLVTKIVIAQSEMPTWKAGHRDTAGHKLSGQELARAYGALPLGFEPNEGQANRSAQFVAHGPGYTLLIGTSGLAIAYEQSAPNLPLLNKLDAQGKRKFEARKIGRMLARLQARKAARVERVGLALANPHAHGQPLGKLGETSNYFIGRDPQKWRTGVPNFARVRYQDVYPGIDLIYYGNRSRLEFDFMVSRGANPGRIRLTFPGQDRASLTKSGDIRLGSRVAGLILRRPSIYQVQGGNRHPVDGGFRLLADGRVGIRVGSYDRERSLIIDPVLAYSTFLTGSAGSDASGIAVDANGNAFVSGSTPSTDFPVVGGYQTAGNPNFVAFVSKLNSTGTQLLYSTYLGGTGGDYSMGIAIDAAGGAYVSGYTFSTDFPVLNGFQTVNQNPNSGNAFVARIDTTQTGSASLIYSTYLGGGGKLHEFVDWRFGGGYRG